MIRLDQPSFCSTGAKGTADQATSETQLLHTESEQPIHFETIPLSNLPGYMRFIGGRRGHIGGKRRLKIMTKKLHRKVAVKAARARSKKGKQTLL
jgi:hypothetical protein